MLQGSWEVQLFMFLVFGLGKEGGGTNTMWKAVLFELFLWQNDGLFGEEAHCKWLEEKLLIPYLKDGKMNGTHGKYWFFHVPMFYI